MLPKLLNKCFRLTASDFCAFMACLDDLQSKKVKTKIFFFLLDENKSETGVRLGQGNVYKVQTQGKSDS